MTATLQDYDDAFRTEREREYPEVDALCARLGYDMNREQLEDLAQVLACPVKARPPCWQHGRVVYAVVRSWMSEQQDLDIVDHLVDVGTAKGFSLMCMALAAQDEGRGQTAKIYSVDVVDPTDRVPRNSVRDLEDPPPSVQELITPYVRRYSVPPDCAVLVGGGAGSADFFRDARGTRFGVVFVDGKHSYEAASADFAAAAAMQRSGDCVVLDDIQLPGVARVADRAAKLYEREDVWAIPGERGYSVLRRK